MAATAFVKGRMPKLDLNRHQSDEINNNYFEKHKTSRKERNYSSKHHHKDKSRSRDP